MIKQKTPAKQEQEFIIILDTDSVIFKNTSFFFVPEFFHHPDIHQMSCNDQ